ncbi:MAG: hypothetical protein CFE25_07425 [Chitinophagaceae bacterium BSSC1]|nr:MAG: hypothetical protein CFE25_07425 [Chitinophagaceae bacterium BSSC1]
MKRIFSLLAFLPLITIAQSKKNASKILPLIESICTDTIKGKYQETVFAYDRFNRLIRIVNRNGHLQKSNNTSTNRWVLDTTSIQKFGYVLDQSVPAYNKTISYESNGKGSKWIASTDTYYFKFEHGIRVMDSVVVKQQSSNGKTETGSYNTIYEQTDTTIRRVTDFSDSNGSDSYVDYLLFHENVITEDNSHSLRSHAGWTKNFTYTKFDNKINPLAQLNIAPILVNEKISFSFEKEELIRLNEHDEEEGTEVNWHFRNQNNALRSTSKRDQRDSQANDINSFSYTYNQYQLPVYCTIYVKKISTGSSGSFRSGFLKHISFRYKK